MRVVLICLFTEKHVDEVEVEENVEEVDDLRDEDLDRPDVVGVEVVHQVLDQSEERTGVT